MNEFIEKFKRVFNDDFSIKTCGRDATISLIYCCQKMRPDINFGDEDSGFMNVKNILDLYKEITA